MSETGKSGDEGRVEDSTESSEGDPDDGEPDDEDGDDKEEEAFADRKEGRNEEDGAYSERLVKEDDLFDLRADFLRDSLPCPSLRLLDKLGKRSADIPSDGAEFVPSSSGYGARLL